jgi:flagellar motor protein MotB
MQRLKRQTGERMLVCCCALALLAVGCKQNPFQSAATTTADAQSVALAQQQTQSLNTQIQDLTKRVGQLDSNNTDLHRQLAQAEQQRQSYQEQVTLLQSQLGDMAAKVKDTQLAKQDVDKQINALQASTRFRGGASISANNSVRQTLQVVALPGIDVHQEGEVIRIELPGDKLFVPGSQQMTAEASRILDEVAAAILRSYPRQRIVIEGHTDNSAATVSGGPHLLTAAQAQVVFQQFVQRNHLPARQLSILAMGENHPRASNATAAGQAKNRRIEIVVYPDTIDG